VNYLWYRIGFRKDLVGANMFVSESYLEKSNNIKRSLNFLGLSLGSWEQNRKEVNNES
jgi:hypothetical protein